MRTAIHTTNGQIDTLTAGLRQRREELKRRRVTSVEAPHAVGVATVTRGPVPRVAKQGQRGSANTADEREPAARCATTTRQHHAHCDGFLLL